MEGRPPDVRRAGRPLGLSTGHISPFGSVEFYKGGSLVVAKRAKICTVNSGGGIRGYIQEFSRKARRRLMQKVSMTKRDLIPMFVTLTYPSEYPSDAREWKRHLDVFDKRLRRKFPKVGYFWKLEPQKRGAPHYHLMVWGVEYLELFMFVAGTWYEVVNSGDEKHLRAGTRVEMVRSWRGVMAYASKYLGKVQDLPAGWNYPGRFWGCRGAIPWAELISKSVTDREAARFMRYMRRFMRAQARQYKTLSMFAASDFWYERFERLII
jgi:hypothetical protein